ncbi:hypothetical protein HK097_004450 [Rhizophlyctis rosea]|uniref:Uncharacterized protein n=1 Tax=Rhizophlyctis rosea TaxID=64517 RepID=A0AAD5SFZ0_9FUNG|nr:hypothetical protein HK097_004450 [Rhizophlyctis rosea]
MSDLQRTIDSLTNVLEQINLSNAEASTHLSQNAEVLAEIRNLSASASALPPMAADNSHPPTILLTASVPALIAAHERHSSWNTAASTAMDGIVGNYRESKERLSAAVENHWVARRAYLEAERELPIHHATSSAMHNSARQKLLSSQLILQLRILENIRAHLASETLISHCDTNMAAETAEVSEYSLVEDSQDEKH